MSLLEYGPDFSGPGKDTFRPDRATGDPLEAHLSNFLHPVFYFYSSIPSGTGSRYYPFSSHLDSSYYWNKAPRAFTKEFLANFYGILIFIRYFLQIIRRMSAYIRYILCLISFSLWLPSLFLILTCHALLSFWACIFIKFLPFLEIFNFLMAATFYFFNLCSQSRQCWTKIEWAPVERCLVLKKCTTSLKTFWPCGPVPRPTSCLCDDFSNRALTLTSAITSQMRVFWTNWQVKMDLEHVLIKISLNSIFVIVGNFDSRLE